MKTDKQKLHKLSIAIGIVGIFIVVASTIRWFFLYPDYSQFAIALGVGIGAIGFAYIHEMMKRIDEQIIEFDNALDALNKYYMEEIDKLKIAIANKIGYNKLATEKE